MFHLSDQINKIMFVSSLIFLVVVLAFAYGLAVGLVKIWPFRTLLILKHHLESVYIAGEWQPSGRFVRAPAGAARQRVTVHRPDSLEAGYRAIMGWNDEEYGIWLLDPEGQDVHYWPIDYQALDPSGPSTLEPDSMKVLEDGSVLVNFHDGNVLARLDACGEPIWVDRGIHHHSIDRADDGSFWTWRADYSAFGPYQYLVNFSPESGHIIRQYSLIDDFINQSPETQQLFAVASGYTYARGPVPNSGGNDLFHPNDIEPLPAAIAAKYPNFRPGDLLVSFRNLHLVAVLDPVDRKIKWWSHGPWRFQHDPDFGENGRILVYNNNAGRGRSNVIAIDPGSRRLDVAYSDGGLRFYSQWAGKLQVLPGGAVLVVVPEEGRVLEASWSGELIFEFNNMWSDAANGYIIDACWLPTTFFDHKPSCPAPAKGTGPMREGLQTPLDSRASDQTAAAPQSSVLNFLVPT